LNLEADQLLGQLTNIAASAGAACHSDNVSISNVLKAIKLSLDYAKGTIRFSLGRFTTENEINKAATEICEIVDQIIKN